MRIYFNVTIQLLKYSSLSLQSDDDISFLLYILLILSLLSSPPILHHSSPQSPPLGHHHGLHPLIQWLVRHATNLRNSLLLHPASSPTDHSCVQKNRGRHTSIISRPQQKSPVRSFLSDICCFLLLCKH